MSGPVFVSLNVLNFLLKNYSSLKTEKVDLENTLVDESQRQSKEYGCASISRNEKCSGMVYCTIV